jgi:protocatechuate 3,4-dioxygenase alpha subunit
VITDFDTGIWAFDTKKPGPVIGRKGRRMSPDLNLWIVARGINLGLNTRMYFEDGDIKTMPVMNLIAQVQRRETLLARKVSPGHYPFDIRLQYEGEIVFMDIWE